MADTISREHRSWNMSRIRNRDTSPERAVRDILYRMGRRLQLHRADLPGRPDIVLPELKVAVFVHGCFWHRHPGCRYAYTPKSRIEFWRGKFADNVRRDRENQARLKNMGWRVIVVWECALKDMESLRRRLQPLAATKAVIWWRALKERLGLKHIKQS